MQAAGYVLVNAENLEEAAKKIKQFDLDDFAKNSLDVDVGFVSTDLSDADEWAGEWKVVKV